MVKDNGEAEHAIGVAEVRAILDGAASVADALVGLQTRIPSPHGPLRGRRAPYSDAIFTLGHGTPAGGARREQLLHYKAFFERVAPAHGAFIQALQRAADETW